MDAGTNECPVSQITARELELIQLFARAKVMKDFGASPYGGDLSKWPSKVVDAFMVFQEEHVRVEGMRVAQSPAPPKPSPLRTINRKG